MDRIVLTPAERQTLERLARARRTPQCVAMRSRVILLVASGTTRRKVATALGVSPPTVTLWAQRFRQLRTAGLMHDAVGRGRKPRISQALRDAILRARMNQESGNSSSRTIRALARAYRVSPASVHRILTTYPKHQL